MSRKPRTWDAPYLLGVRRRDCSVELENEYPYSLPFFAGLDLDLSSRVTFFVGENGSGKSTLLEALASACGFPADGGGRNDLELRLSGPNPLADQLRVSFRIRPYDGFFFRAETLVKLADVLDTREHDPDFRGQPFDRYGGRSLHARSHGEAFLEVLGSRREGLLLLDEPEAALSAQRQIEFMTLLDAVVREGRTQVIIATHSPLLLTFPEATIVSFDEARLPTITLRETSAYQLTRAVLANPEGFWHKLRDGE